MTTLDDIPSELLSLIIQHVNKTDLLTCSVVNKSFHKQVMSLIWHHFDIDSDQVLDELTTLITHSPHHSGHYIRSILLVNCWSLTDDSFLALMQHLPCLEILKIPQADQLSDISFQHVPIYCPHLVSVDLFCSRIPEDCGRLTHVSIQSLGQHCHQLSRLSLYGCAYLDYELFFASFQACSFLTHLHLSLPYILDGQPIPGPYLVEKAALNLHQYHHHALTSLCLSECDIDVTVFITASNKHQLTWPHLTEFSLWMAPTLTDTHAITFLQRHPQLQKLSLHHSIHLTDHGFLAPLPTLLPRLTYLDVDYNHQLTVGGICHMIMSFAGNLMDGVHCDGCGIYEMNDDFPPYLKKSGLYRLRWEDMDDPEVVWISGHAFF